MTPSDEWILNYMRTANYDHRTCPHAALQYMAEKNTRYIECDYKNLRNTINRRMKIMEKYGIVRYTGETVSFNDKSKIWEVVE